MVLAGHRSVPGSDPSKRALCLIAAGPLLSLALAARCRSSAVSAEVTGRYLALTAVNCEGSEAPRPHIVLTLVRLVIKDVATASGQHFI